jgi:hypothetical protein
MLKDFLKHQDNSNDLFFSFHSFFNIESGSFALGSFNQNDCDDCTWSSLDNNAVGCESCLRDPSNYLVGLAGDGDGVYTVWEIWDANYRTIGILAVFDSGYATATSAREAIESGQSPTWDDEYVSEFVKTKRMHVGTIEETSIIIIGETGLKENTGYALINVLTGAEDDSDFEVSFFVEEPGSQSGSYPSDSTFKPRVVLALRAENSHLAGPEEIRGKRVNWAEQELASLSNVVASHIEPMGITAAYGNFLYRLLDLQECVENGSPEAIVEEAKRFAGVWALFIEYHSGDTEASDQLKSLGFKFTANDFPQMLALAGIADESFRFGGAKEDLQLAASNGSNSTGPKFCSECGGKRSGEAKFCPDCGNKFGQPTE